MSLKYSGVWENSSDEVYKKNIDFFKFSWNKEV